MHTVKFCTCEDGKDIMDKCPDLFRIHPYYGWVLFWIELSLEKEYTNVNKFALDIKYCPFCGKELLHAI